MHLLIAQYYNMAYKVRTSSLLLTNTSPQLILRLAYQSLEQHAVRFVDHEPE